MSLLRPCVEAMTPYVPGRQPPPGLQVVKLNTNENPYPPSPRVAEAITEELSGSGDGLRRYSDPSAASIRQAAADVTAFPLEGILVGNGSDELLALVVRACVEPGQVVQYPEPTYVLYETLAMGHGARVRKVPFGPTFELPEELCGSEARLTFVASPGSPSGNTHPVEALERLAKSLPNGVVVVDEAYAEFAEDDALALARRLPNVLVARTLSKGYSLAGLRVGLLFGSTELVQGISRIKDSYNIDRLAIVGASAALRDQTWMQRNVERVRRSRERLIAALVEFGLDVLPSQANFVFARFISAAVARSTFQSLEADGILVRYFDRPGLDDGLRITVGTDEEVDLLLASLGRHLG
jgi:histidinol-phosphate aminotransferase